MYLHYIHFHTEKNNVNGLYFDTLKYSLVTLDIDVFCEINDSIQWSNCWLPAFTCKVKLTSGISCQQSTVNKIFLEYVIQIIVPR